MSVENSVSEREREVNRILADYLESQRQGNAPDRQDLLRRHPDLADELRRSSATWTISGGWPDPLPHLPLRGQQHGSSARPRCRSRARHGSLLRRLRAAGGDRPRRHGRRLQGPAGEPEPHRGPEDDPRRPAGVAGTTCGASAREAEAAANLDHPHIVPIYEVGEHEGQHYFSMKLVEGGSLAGGTRRQLTADRRGRGAGGHGRPGRPPRPPARHPPPRPQAGATSCSMPQGQPHVTDFGLAKRVEGDTTAMTRTGSHRRHAQLHGARAGRAASKVLTTARRRLQPGRDPLRAADRPAAVPGGDAAGDAPAGAGAGARAAAHGRSPGRPRPGDDLPEVPGEGPGAALRFGRRRWRTTWSAGWTASRSSPGRPHRSSGSSSGRGAVRPSRPWSASASRRPWPC